MNRPQLNHHRGLAGTESTTGSRISRRSRSLGFTIMEMIVVVIMLLAVLAMVLPSFVSLKRSGEYTVAQELLKQAVRDARGRALSAKNDTAVVFVFSPDTGIQLLVCERVGQTILDRDTSQTGGGAVFVEREVFVPITGRKPVEIPRGVSIRGYAKQFSVDNAWYEPTQNGGVRYLVDEPAWVFPETDFYSRLVADNQANSAADVGRDRQTFMVRFASRTGQLVTGEAAAAVVVLPRPSASGRQRDLAAIERLDLSADLASQVASIIERPLWPGGSTSPLAQRDLLGDDSGDTALVRSVTRLALYRERDLAAALGVRLDPVSGTIYELPENYQTAGGAQRDSRTVYPQYVLELREDSRTPLSVLRWVEGFGVLTDASSTVRSAGGRSLLYSVHPLRGELLEEISR